MIFQSKIQLYTKEPDNILQLSKWGLVPGISDVPENLLEI